MHDLISEFQLTSSAAAHGKTHQQTQVSSREIFGFLFPCESIIFGGSKTKLSFTRRLRSSAQKPELISTFLGFVASCTVPTTWISHSSVQPCPSTDGNYVLPLAFHSPLPALIRHNIHHMICNCFCIFVLCQTVSLLRSETISSS